MQRFICWALVMALPFTSSGQNLQPLGLRCEYRGNPLGMDEAHPRLSWGLFSWEQDQYQSAYRILIATAKGLLDMGRGDWWDSGKVTDSENINIVPGGRPLEPFTRYFWKVMVWDQHGRTKGWSEVGWFETGMLGESHWRGKWISENRPVPMTDADFYKDAPAPLFRKVFSVSKPVRSARLYISGLGYNEASINGRKVGDAVLDPAWTDYRHTIFYSVYDVAGMLHAGRNAIGVVLGNGWYDPLPLRFWGRINFREALTVGQPKVLANLRITYTDGSAETIATDESWRTGESAILRNNVFLGEKVDGRLERKDWCSPALDDRDWPLAIAADAPGGRLEASIMAPISVNRRFLARTISEPEPQVYVADMGWNFAGWLRVRLHGRAGQEVHFRYGEILQPNGRVNGLTTVAGQIKEMWHVNGGPGAPPTAYQEDVYVCRGDDSDVFQPHFTFHGFRYVEITGLDRQPADSDLMGLGLSNDVGPGRGFVCSDTLLKGIQKMVTGTFLSNLFSVQSDCPGREKQGYGGDIVATADAFIYNFDMSCFYPKTLGDFADAVRPNGGMPECAPYNGIADEGFGEGTGPIGWQLAFPFLQRELYRFYGNKRVVEEQYGNSVRLVEFLRSQAKDGLIDHGIGDHEAVNPKHVPLTSGAFYYGHVKLLAELARILGKQEDSRRWSALADSIKLTFNERYLQSDGGRYDTAANQTTQVFPLWWGLAKDPEKSFAQLVRLIEDTCKGHLSTGIFGTKMLFDVLNRFDRNDLAYKIVTRRDYPGYVYMRDHGATTLIESWGLTDQNSWNHPMFGSVSEWFYRGLAGMNPADDAYGMNKVVFRMRPVGGLSLVRAAIWSVRGKFESEWLILEGKLNWIVTLPPNTRGEVDIPADRNDKVTKDGKVLDKALWTDGFFRVSIVSGVHRFVVTKNKQ
jgi:alpha-L-rhamnosidase